MTPVLVVNPRGVTHRIYIVQPGEVWMKGKFAYRPIKTASLILETVTKSPGTYRVEEVSLRDEQTWKWISEMMQLAVNDGRPEEPK